MKTALFLITVPLLFTACGPQGRGPASPPPASQPDPQNDPDPADDPPATSTDTGTK